MGRPKARRVREATWSMCSLQQTKKKWGPENKGKIHFILFFLSTSSFTKTSYIDTHTSTLTRWFSMSPATPHSHPVGEGKAFINRRFFSRETNVTRTVNTWWQGGHKTSRWFTFQTAFTIYSLENACLFVAFSLASLETIFIERCQQKARDGTSPHQLSRLQLATVSSITGLLVLK